MQAYEPTIDDTYTVQMDQGGEKQKELVVFHDTAGISNSDGPIELRRPYVQVKNIFINENLIATEILLFVWSDNHVSQSAAKSVLL